ncbi:hypothetical protein LTS18_013611, partial [Coniosporium uncinatum]
MNYGDGFSLAATVNAYGTSSLNTHQGSMSRVLSTSRSALPSNGHIHPGRLALINGPDVHEESAVSQGEGTATKRVTKANLTPLGPRKGLRAAHTAPSHHDIADAGSVLQPHGYVQSKENQGFAPAPHTQEVLQHPDTNSVIIRRAGASAAMAPEQVIRRGGDASHTNVVSASRSSQRSRKTNKIFHWGVSFIDLTEYDTPYDFGSGQPLPPSRSSKPKDRPVKARA